MRSATQLPEGCRCISVPLSRVCVLKSSARLQGRPFYFHFANGKGGFRVTSGAGHLGKFPASWPLGRVLLILRVQSLRWSSLPPMSSVLKTSSVLVSRLPCRRASFSPVFDPDLSHRCFHQPQRAISRMAQRLPNSVDISHMSLKTGSLFYKWSNLCPRPTFWESAVSIHSLSAPHSSGPELSVPPMLVPLMALMSFLHFRQWEW